MQTNDTCYSNMQKKILFKTKQGVLFNCFMYCNHLQGNMLLPLFLSKVNKNPKKFNDGMKKRSKSKQGKKNKQKKLKIEINKTK